MSEALAEVRRQLGEDAVVLHTRSVKRGGLLGLGARSLVEITAGDGHEIARYRAAKRGQRSTPHASHASRSTPPFGGARGAGPGLGARSGLGEGRVLGEGHGHGLGEAATRAFSGAGSQRSHADVPSRDRTSSSSPATALRQHPAAGDLIRRTYQAAQAELSSRTAASVAADPQGRPPPLQSPPPPPTPPRRRSSRGTPRGPPRTPPRRPRRSRRRPP